MIPRALACCTLPLLGAVAASACSSGSASKGAPSADAGALQDMAPTRPADPAVATTLIGTGGFGFATGSAFPGATAPQGLAKLGPDTTGPWGTINFLHCSGYWYGDDTIQGFSHMHLHGTGVPDYGVLGMMPLPSFDPSKTTMSGYASPFDKSTESTSPGTYAVTLANGGIRAEMTATGHAGHDRYTFAAGSTTGHVVVDLDHHIASGSVADETLALEPSSSTFSGSFRSLGGLSSGFGGSMIYFAAKTSAPWTASLVWSQGGAPAAGTQASGTGVGADLAFDVSSGAPVELQVGLSFVSTAAAAANLAAEMPAFAFDAEAAATAAEWQKAISVVVAEGGTATEQAMMGAALYHLFLMPSIQSDVAGTYVGLDGKVATATGFHYCSEMSLWDTYRTLVPLWDLVAPDRALDQVQSLLAMSQASGFFPKWPIGDGEAGTMIGASAEVVIADAYVKGIRGFDAEGAYATLSAAAMSTTTPAGGRGGRNQVVPYMQLGYVPGASTAVDSAVSLTIEYGQDDAALAQLAAGLGHASDAATLSARLHGWQKLYDPASGLLWAKDATGAWSTPHGDGTLESDDFDEANAQQSVWGPWYDVAGLEKVMGGSAKLVDKLEAFFENGKADYDAIEWTAPLSVGAVRKYYWGGNEPDIHTPYLFALAGRPDLTQKWVPWVESEVFTAGADGIPGNDDAGTMSAWLVFSMLGFYPVPGTDLYVVGTPAFTRATLAVTGGTFTVLAPAASPRDVYVQSVTLDGKPLTTPTFHHAAFVPGGTLSFVMGPEPSTWGQSSD